MRKSIDIESAVQLLVEGKEEEEFFNAFIRHLFTTSDTQVRSFFGVDNLKRFLPTFVKKSNFDKVRSLGIVRDADQSADQAFQSVQGSLRVVGLPVPERPGAVAASRLEVRVLVLPGDGKPGMLETLLCQTFADTEEDRCIQAFFSCIEAAKVTIKRPAKARARAYVVTKPEPHVSVGVAAQKGYWDFDHEALDGVRQFLVALHRS